MPDTLTGILRSLINTCFVVEDIEVRQHVQGQTVDCGKTRFLRQNAIYIHKGSCIHIYVCNHICIV